MLFLSAFFLVAAIIAAILAYGGVVARAQNFARIFLWVFIILFVASIIVYTYTVNFSIPSQGDFNLTR